MISQNSLLKIAHYLNLYEKNFLHGEFLMMLVGDEIDKIFKIPDLDQQIKIAIEEFINKTENYEPHKEVRKTDTLLLGDKELLEETKKIYKVISLNNTQINEVNKFPPTYKNMENSLINYVIIFKKGLIEEEDLMKIIKKIFDKYLGEENFSKKNYETLKNIKSIILALNHSKKFKQKKLKMIIEELFKLK